jgi:hypothetical protein
MEGLQSLQFLIRFLPSRPSRNRKRSNTTWLHTCDILYHMGVITKSSNPRSISSLDQDNPRPADPIPAHAHQPETRHEAQLKPECHTPNPIRVIVPQPFSPFRLEVLRRGSQSCKPLPPDNNNNNNQKHRCRRNAKPVAEPANRGSDFKASCGPSSYRLSRASSPRAPMGVGAALTPVAGVQSSRIV